MLFLALEVVAYHGLSRAMEKRTVRTKRMSHLYVVIFICFFKLTGDLSFSLIYLRGETFDQRCIILVWMFTCLNLLRYKIFS